MGETLIRRGMQVDGRCKRCGESETVFHVMFTCHVARKVWDLVPALAVPSLQSCNSVEDLLTACARLTNLPPTGLAKPLYPWIFWVLWTSRNQLSFEDKSFSETEMLNKALKAAKEWQASLLQRKQCSVSSKNCHVSKKLPLVPDNVSMLFLDAAWNASSLAGGLGWVCTDSKGTCCFEGNDNRRYIASALAAEALALRAGLLQTVSTGIKEVVCFSDSKCLIDLITGHKSVVALRGILHDIDVLSASFTFISFVFISRVCNESADRLAKNALFLFTNTLFESENSIVR